MTVESFGDNVDEEIRRLQTAWREERYQPQPLRRVWIDKPGSREQRPLGISTVRDRVVQAALSWWRRYSSTSSAPTALDTALGAMPMGP